MRHRYAYKPSLEPTCIVCTEEYRDDGRRYVRLPCRHGFCEVCIARLDRCPICRRDVITGTPQETRSQSELPVNELEDIVRIVNDIDARID